MIMQFSKSIYFIFVLIYSVSASTEYIDPEYLDMLLDTEQYDKFSEVTGIHKNLVHFHHNKTHKSTPESLKGIVMGDIILNPKRMEQGRQGDPDIRWPDQTVYYSISRKFTPKSLRNIMKSINHWNDVVDCVKWRPRFMGKKNYVMFLIGDKDLCQSNIGMSGGMQPLYLDEDGCMSMDTILHEMDHAIGIIHEHTRKDRDTYVKVLWDNIPKSWHEEYYMDNTSKILGDYDYYSFMHYFYLAPDEYKDPAFEILTEGIDTKRIGRTKDFTEIDLQKINKLYCGDDDYDK